jgi:hypothetical protein
MVHELTVPNETTEENSYSYLVTEVDQRSESLRVNQNKIVQLCSIYVP